jgi:hypothetical protein
MRRLLPVLLLALAAGAPAAATDREVPGWTAVSCSCAQANAVDAVDAQVLYLGTSRGVSRSDDGGLTWRPLPVPLTADVTRVAFANRDDGAAAGRFEGVLVTHDGGSSWQHVRGAVPGLDPPLAAPPHRRGVASEQVLGTARRGSTVYAVGAGGLIARSTDGGATWSYERPPASYERSSFEDVDALDPDHAWVAVHSGRVLIRNASRAEDVTTSPHRDVGAGLLGLAGVAALGALVMVATGRPKPLTGALAGVVVVAGAAGALAVTQTQTCRASGCTDVLSQAETPRTTSTASPSVPSVAQGSPGSQPLTIPSAAPPAGSAGPSGTSLPLVPLPFGASAGATGPFPGAPATVPATTGSLPSQPEPSRTAVPPPAGAFTVLPAQQDSVCLGAKSNQPSVVAVVLRNTTTGPVTWSAQARETLTGGAPWATLSDAAGTLASGTTTTLDVTPAKALCDPKSAPATGHVDVVHDGLTSSVAVTVLRPAG